jgi:hypothetical protein
VWRYGITVKAYVALQHNLSGRYIIHKRHSKVYKDAEKCFFKFKETRPFKLKKISGGNRGNHKLSIDATLDPC